MWVLDRFFAPELPAAQRILYIDIAHKISVFECLIRWAEAVERDSEHLYVRHPFSGRKGPDTLATTLNVARMTLGGLMLQPSDRNTLASLNREITKLADELASWVGLSPPAYWSVQAFLTLMDLWDYEP